MGDDWSASVAKHATRQSFFRGLFRLIFKNANLKQVCARASISFMHDQRAILAAILSQYSLPKTGAHGVLHWARVMENGHICFAPMPHAIS